jgi:hypothetical protein
MRQRRSGCCAAEPSLVPGVSSPLVALVRYAVLGSSCQLFSWTRVQQRADDRSCRRHSHVRYAQRYAGNRSGVGDCGRCSLRTGMAGAGWLSGRRLVGLRSPTRCGTRYARPGSHDVRRRNRAGRAPCRVRTATHSRSRTGRDRPRRMVAARGEALLGAGIAARMLQRFGRAAIGLVPSSPSVRPRSWGCWPGGRDNAGVARRLGVSPETVHNHASNIITMLHVSDRSGAIFRARDAGLGGPLGRAELPLPLVSRSSSAIIDDHRR